MSHTHKASICQHPFHGVLRAEDVPGYCASCERLNAIEAHLNAPRDAWAEEMYNNFVAEKRQAELSDPPMPVRTAISAREKHDIAVIEANHANINYMQLDRKRDLAGLPRRGLRFRSKSYLRWPKPRPARPARVLHAPDTPVSFEKRQRDERRSRIQHLKATLAAGFTLHFEGSANDAGRHGEGAQSRAPIVISSDEESSSDSSDEDESMMDVDDPDDEDASKSRPDLRRLDVKNTTVPKSRFKNMDGKMRVGKSSGPLDLSHFIWTARGTISGHKLMAVIMDDAFTVQTDASSYIEQNLMLTKLLRISKDDARRATDQNGPPQQCSAAASGPTAIPQTDWTAAFTFRSGSKTGGGKTVVLWGHVDGIAPSEYDEGAQVRYRLLSVPHEDEIATSEDHPLLKNPWVRPLAFGEVHGNEVVIINIQDPGGPGEKVPRPGNQQQRANLADNAATSTNSVFGTFSCDQMNAAESIELIGREMKSKAIWYYGSHAGVNPYSTSKLPPTIAEAIDADEAAILLPYDPDYEDDLDTELD